MDPAGKGRGEKIGGEKIGGRKKKEETNNSAGSVLDCRRASANMLFEGRGRGGLLICCLRVTIFQGDAGGRGGGRGRFTRPKIRRYLNRGEGERSERKDSPKTAPSLLDFSQTSPRENRYNR